jgi:phosphoglycolate phosphatase
VRFHLIIFDLDGTLVDTLPDIAASLNHTLQAGGLSPLPEDTIRRLVGEGMRRLVEKALAAQPDGPRTASEEEIQALVAGHNRYYADHVCVHSRRYDGILDLLANLERRPWLRLAVLSNKPGTLVRSLLQALSLTPFMDAVLGDYDGFPIKPDPGAAQSLLQRFSVSREQTIMVGDGIPDMQLAHALGCSSAAVAWGFTAVDDLRAQHPSAVLQHPSDLLALVD